MSGVILDMVEISTYYLLRHSVQRDCPAATLEVGDCRGDVWRAGARVVVDGDVNAGSRGIATGGVDAVEDVFDGRGGE